MSEVNWDALPEKFKKCLDRFPEPYRTQIAENMMICPAAGWEKTLNLIEASGSFWWGETGQGANYWSEFYHRVMRGEFGDPNTDIDELDPPTPSVSESDFEPETSKSQGPSLPHAEKVFAIVDVLKGSNLLTAKEILRSVEGHIESNAIV